MSGTPIHRSHDMSATREYEVTVYFSAQRSYRITAKNREQAIGRASRRAERAGLDVTVLRAPFLEGDKE